MSGRKRKLYASDLVSYGLYYSSAYRTKDEHGKYTAYCLCKEPPAVVRDTMRYFQNVRFYRYQKRFSPEKRGYILRVYDKCIKDVEQ